MIHVIIINGPPGAGKDTFIEMVSAALQKIGRSVGSFSSIDPVREMLSSAGFDLTEKTEADRKLLAIVGDAVEEHSNWRTNRCVLEVEDFRRETHGTGVFFLHIREPHNIALVRDLCTMTISNVKFITVLVDGIRAEKITNNAADAGVQDMIYDRTIYNNGSKADLRKVAQQFAVDLDRFHV